jgi:OmpA-OmpF porin, OOP family
MISVKLDVSTSMNDTKPSDDSSLPAVESGDFSSFAQKNMTVMDDPIWRQNLPTQRRSKAPLIAFLFLVLIALSVTLFLLEYERRSKPISQTQKSVTLAPDSLTAPRQTKPQDARSAAEESLRDTKTAPILPDLDDPLDLVTAIGKALASNDIAKAEQLIGSRALPPESLARLRNLSAGQQLKLRHPEAVREVGELEINKRIRYSLELADRENGRDRIYLDLFKGPTGWIVEKITFPPSLSDPIPRALIVDALGITDAFLLAVLDQNFARAKGFVNAATVSDASLAGLCILFEEGHYKLRSEKPLRATLQKEQLTTFLANVVTADGSPAAQFGITLRKQNLDSPWIIDELNLDQLLNDYATRIAGGDVFYTPLIKNPTGGDTLVLYFDFDTNELTPRTKRQLSIVAQLLTTDTQKKLNLSGHTDSLGSRDYNQQLSKQRALAVRDFLVVCGVNPNQIITAAKGLSEPRRPNVTTSGQDDPEGRRANRRTEIYLDF